MLTLNDAIAKKMEDPEFKAEWDALEPEFQIIRAIIEGREENDFTQAQLAGNRHPPSRHQPTGERNRKPVSAYPQAARRRHGDEAQPRVHSPFQPDPSQIKADASPPRGGAFLFPRIL